MKRYRGIKPFSCSRISRPVAPIVLWTSYLTRPLSTSFASSSRHGQQKAEISGVQVVLWRGKQNDQDHADMCPATGPDGRSALHRPVFAVLMWP